MAKDKSKKSDGTETSKPKGGDLGFAKPSEAPAPGESWNLTEEGENELLLITPMKLDETETKKYGVKPYIEADVVVINSKKPAKSEAHEGVWIFGGYLIGALKGFVGERKVLGRLVKVDDKAAGKGFHWEFADADADDVEAATEYINSVDVFKAKK